MHNTKESTPFWEYKALEQMNQEEWESLCDGCARCCLHKLEDEDTGEVHYTSVACRHLDLDNCRCQCYPQRSELVAECIQLDAQHLEPLAWLPDTCAYRRLAQGKPLPSWHPLITQDSNSTTLAGISVHSYAITECADTELEEYLILFSDDQN